MNVALLKNWEKLKTKHLKDGLIDYLLYHVYSHTPCVAEVATKRGRNGIDFCVERDALVQTEMTEKRIPTFRLLVVVIFPIQSICCKVVGYDKGVFNHVLFHRSVIIHFIVFHVKLVYG